MGGKGGLRGGRGENIFNRGGRGEWGNRSWGVGVKGGEDLREEKGEKILGRKREKISGGEKALGGKGGKDLNRERGEKILYREEQGEKISGRDGGKRS